VTLPAYGLVDLAGELQLVRGGSGAPELSGTLRVENLFDQQYDQVVGFAGRPRGVFGGARFRF
jgi:outer membrane receptor protein involved in Fe transport